MSTDLFGRDYRLTVDTLQIKNLDINFAVRRALKKEPNTAEIQIRNLKKDNAKQMEERREVRVKLEAGYEKPGRISLIFDGDLREIHTERDGGDLVTILASGDGEKSHRRARINRGFAPGTSIEKVIGIAAAEMGVGLGNLKALGEVEFPGAGGVFPNGTVLSGTVADELGEVLRSAGLEYSIQSGVLQILTRKQALAGTALLINSDSGLVGTPSISSDGTLRAQLLMLPDVFPGIAIKMDADDVQGLFRVVVAEYAGDTATNDWFIDIEGEPLLKVAA